MEKQLENKLSTMFNKYIKDYVNGFIEYIGDEMNISKTDLHDYYEIYSKKEMVTEKKKSPPKINLEIEEGCFIIVLDYSEKCHAIFGDTLRIYSKLKPFGFFNQGLRFGTGWVIRKEKLASLEKMLTENQETFTTQTIDEIIEKQDIQNFIQKETMEESEYEEVEIIDIYTDGACKGNPGKGGWGVVYYLNDREYTLNGYEPDTTNNKMELKAVIEALKMFPENPLCIYTDSMYVKNGVEKWMINWKKNKWKTSDKKDVKNKELWVEIDTLISEREEVEFKWVKGHSGHKGNERADQLANEAIPNN